jgi:hypothetical protein
MHRRWRHLAFVVVAVLGVGGGVGCRKKSNPAPTPTPSATAVDDGVAKYKGAIQAKVAMALRIGASLPKPPARESLKVEKGPIHLLVGPTAKIAASGGARGGNATILDPEDMKGDLTTSADVKYGMGENAFIDCAAIVAGKSPASTFSPSADAKQTSALLQQCASFTYLLVLVASKKTDPLVDKANKRFVPGHVEGDILVFDLASGKALGGFKVSGRNSDSLTVNMDDPWHDLEREMSQKLWTSIEAGLSSHVPGSSIVNLY